MHIPDVLGPQTWISFYGLMIPIWTISANKAKKNLKGKYVPAMAIGSAFSFIIMMFNIPIPGGSTGHAIGATILSIIFGPWISSIIITITLAIQALLFGDGGITSFAVNSFIMAYIPSFIGFYLYKLISVNASEGSTRKIIGAAIGGYFSLVVASLVTGIILGVQPILNHTNAGTPLYFPYSLKVSIPAMVIEHLLVFGWIEAILTAIVISYLVKEKNYLFSLKEEGQEF